MARTSDNSDEHALALFGSSMLAVLIYAVGPPLAAVFDPSIHAYSDSAAWFALGQTLVVTMGSWLMGRFAFKRHVRVFEERLAPRFTGGMFLWSNSVHASTTTVNVPPEAQSRVEWSAYGGSTTVNGTPIDLAIEGKTWTLMVSIHTGHRLWYQHRDNLPVRNHYETPPSRWGSPATPDDRLDRLSAIGPEALEHMDALVAEFDRYDPALFIHPDMVRVVLYNVFDPPKDALWANAGRILTRVVDLASCIQPAERPIRTVDAIDVFYRDWFTSVEADFRLRVWLIWGSLGLLCLLGYWVACQLAFPSPFT